MSVIETAFSFSGPTGLSIDFDPKVISHFFSNSQRRLWSSEAGGQLFASFSRGRWRVLKATGPRRSDIRSRFSFRPDRKAEKAEILALFDQGLHYVGDWHTHPQDVPEPSGTDLTNIADTVRASTHSLPGFIMVIVGRIPASEGLWVSFHDIRGGVIRCLSKPVDSELPS